MLKVLNTEMKYSKDKSVSFNSETHTYFKKDKKLISVTTFLSAFKNKFDSDYWSEKIAKRENTTKEVILKKWKDKAFKSTEIGTAIHKIFEDYTNNEYFILNEEIGFNIPDLEKEFYIDYNKKRKVAIDFINDFFVSKRLTPIESEFIVCDKFLAGQIDNISKDSENNYYILDFKTNEKIDYDSYNKKMKGILCEFNDSSFYHYSLQLSIYREILKEYKIKNMYLVHITETNYKLIECIDLLKEINLKDLIKNYKELTNQSALI